MPRFARMAYQKPDDMVFGTSRKPLSYGLGIKVGTGRVIPEAKYAPRPGVTQSPDRLKREFVDYMSKDIIHRAVNMGFPDLQLETEWISHMGADQRTSGDIVCMQKDLIEGYHAEYGINLAVRQTIPDLRECELGLRPGRDSIRSHPEQLFESAETACSNGADVLSVETLGGKEICDYAVTQGDIVGFLFGMGCLGSIDARYVWDEFVGICRRGRTVPGGDTACSGANTVMFMAGGYLDNDVQKTFSALCRCISAARSLVPFECGATGPGKDCAYEGTIVKAITGLPISQEGKNAGCAHFDLMGNLMAQCCDLWSDESVEYHPDFGGSSVACWAGSLGYECSLMNTASASGNGKVLRDLYMLSDRVRSPESYILSYDNAWAVGKAIVDNRKDYYLRARAAAIAGANIILEGYRSGELGLSKRQLEKLYRMIRDLESLPDDSDAFMESCLKRYSAEVSKFDPANYGL